MAETDGGRSEGTGSDARDVRRSMVNQQQAVNNQQFAGTQDATGNALLTSFNSAHYHRLPKLTLPNFDGDVHLADILGLVRVDGAPKL